MNKIKTKFTFREFLNKSRMDTTAHKVMFTCIIVMISAAVAFAGAGLYFLQRKNNLANTLSAAESRISSLKKETVELETERKRFAETKDRLLKQATFVQMLNRISWSRVFGSVAAELPPELSLTSFKISEKGEVFFEGEAFQVESVAELMRRVDGSVVLSSGKFNFLKEKDVDKKKIFNFGVNAQSREKTDKDGLAPEKAEDEE